MNKIILWMQSSLDGFTEGPNGEFDWPVVGPDLTAHFVSRLGAAGMFLYGRKVYEGMAAYWPTADADPNSDGNHVAFSKLWKPMPKAVFSRSLTSAEWNTTVLKDIEKVRELQQTASGDLVFFGGSEVAGQLVQAGLIDEYQIFIHPVVLGGGARLLPAPSDRHDVSLVDTRLFGETVNLHYARRR